MTPSNLVYAALGGGTLGLLFAWYKSMWVNKQDQGTGKMVEIGDAIREGAMAFLAREYRMLGLFVVIVAALLAFSYDAGQKMVAVAFVVGALCSGLAGFFGMRVATASNTRTAQGARTGLPSALQVAFSGGAVMGMCVVGLALSGLTLLLLIFSKGMSAEVSELQTRILPILSGFSLGASSIALFARVGGGIYTKAADVGADLVGKVEAGIPEDDPRNPATIADNVGDNVGDVAGMGADLFESYVGCILSSMVIGASIGNINLVVLPLVLAALFYAYGKRGNDRHHNTDGGQHQRQHHQIDVSDRGTNNH